MRTVSVAVVALLLLAGCNAAPSLDGTDSPTGTVTPVDVPADYDYAPGVTADGVSDPSTLAEAHESVLAGSSFSLTANRTVRYANGSLREQLLLDVALADDRTYLASAATRGPAAPVFLGRPPANGTYWSNRSIYVRKLTRDDRTTYNEFDVPSSGAGTWRYWTRTVPFGGEQATPGGFYRSLFASVPVRVDDENRTGDVTTYRLVGGDIVENRFQDDASDVRNVRLAATVRQDGLVSSLSLRYEGEIDGATVTVVWTINYRKVESTTVERPSWFEKAVRG